MQLITNKTDLSIFDSFNRDYSINAISLCPELADIEIIAVHHYNSNQSARKIITEKDTFAYFLDSNITPKYAEIIINVEACELFELTDQEQHAAIAHEIGHVIFQLSSQKDYFQDQIEELFSDDYACKIGLKSSLLSILNKFVNSGFYTEEKLRPIWERISAIENKKDDNIDNDLFIIGHHISEILRNNI